ncbi:baseplate J/gp47 family protein [uncultured Flavonifractor sp.]|uniref:baseplate J/gp47 family protein n=1 Tax=uncultured Flavonifractor sp. TaxID=1193534 RepID=UPI00261290F3|nr:baseplate J/gp47 family protein [uncultured Flavonifractor sp.]
MTVDEIYNQMAALFQQETGLTLSGGGDMAVRLYAVASQIYGLYTQADWVNRQCFPQTAVEDYLDLHAQLRGLTRREATAAEGVIRFEIDAAGDTDLVVAAGTVCMTAGGLRFETTEEGVIAAGETEVEVPAVAAEPGASGNVAAGTIRAMAVAPVGVNRCTNPEGFSGGVDTEDDEALRSRVLETYQRMPNGANAAFYQQGAMSFPQVAAATVIPRPRGVGTVDVVIATAAGVPDQTLLEEVQEYFEARREIAVELQVRAPEVKNVTVTIRVAAEDNRDGASVRQAVKQAIRSWFDGRLLGQDILRAKLGELTFAVDGVKNYVIDAPTADVAVDSDVLPRLSSLTISELGAGT